ncbi:MAG: type II toxin-antitoxin system antitoxin, RelB/DinJ family [Eubacteriales bacterium]|nr:type II toxin-antitoxin system antitoxin, RelB/DinJ family [Eubacteriales bacterium]
MMAKTANLYARIEPEVKEKAESILSDLGIFASNGIISVQPVSAAKLTEEQMSRELEKGYVDMLNGKMKPAKKAFADIRKDYGV